MGDLLDLLLLLVTVRAFWRLLSGVVSGIAKQRNPPPPSGAPAHGVQMVRDPVCGTFVVPERAVALTLGHRQLYFCSQACRDRYRPEPAEGRTA